MLRLLIVDDEVIVRKWLTLVFQPFDKEFVVVDAAANGHDVQRFARRQHRAMARSRTSP